MPHGHSAIDSLIALTALRKYQAGGPIEDKSATASIDNLITDNEQTKEWPFKKRSLRSRIREAAGQLSELPIFENKYYDLFKTPLDKFQALFPENGEMGWRDDSGQWNTVDSKTLQKLWRKAGAPMIEVRDYKRSMAAPREFAFSDEPNKLQQAMGYLFGVPRVIQARSPFGGERGDAGDVVSELAHQIHFEDPKKYGHTRKSMIEDMYKSVTSREGMSPEEERAGFYDRPGTMEYLAHREIEPQLLDWIKQNYVPEPEVAHISGPLPWQEELQKQMSGKLGMQTGGAVPQGKSPYKQSQVPMSIANLRFKTPIGEESLYGKLFGVGTGVAESLAGSSPSSVWSNYMSQAATAADTLKRFPVPSAGALLLHEAARSKGIGIGGGGLSLPTKYGKFRVGPSNIGGERGVKLQFDLDKSILGALEKRLMR